MDEFWVNTLALIDRDGHQLGSRAGQSSEITGFSAKLNNVGQTFLFNKIRNLSPYYACAEFLWYLSMTNDTSFLQLFAPSYKRFTEDGIYAFGAYGERWDENARNRGNDVETIVGHIDQLTTAIETLRRHPESRQVIMTMWDGTDLIHARELDKKDLPCTLSHQFLLRNGYLHMITTMRSNDAWLGLPYDVFCNTQLLKLIADILGVLPGSYTHNAGSMHFYERNFEKINKILNSHRSELRVDAPISEHKAGISNLGFKDQVAVAIEFVRTYCDESTSKGTIPINFIDEMMSLHSTIADAAFICAAKIHKDLKQYIIDPQLRRALDGQE